MGAQAGKEVASPSSGSLESRGIKTVDPAVARKLAANRGGVNYNLRVIIRGDRETGKSCLLRRLKGGEFIEKHEETTQIQVDQINWNYKATSDCVMVEVWDVVDKSAAATPKLLDSTQLDVYQGSHAVILLIDPTRDWTFEYAKRELLKIPKHLDILLLANFRDSPAAQRVLSESQLQNFMRSQPENVKYIECSLKNGFGLRNFYSFLNVPFLKLKISTLNQLMKQSRAELTAAEQEIELLLEQDYESYIQWLAVQLKPDGKKESSKPNNSNTNETAKPTSSNSGINKNEKKVEKPAAEQKKIPEETLTPPQKESKKENRNRLNDTADDLDSFNPGDSVESSFFDDERPTNSAIAARAERTKKIEKKNRDASDDELESDEDALEIPSSRPPIEIEEDFDSFGIESEKAGGSSGSVFGAGAEMLVKREENEKDKEKEKILREKQKQREIEKERERETERIRDREREREKEKEKEREKNQRNEKAGTARKSGSDSDSPKIQRRKNYKFSDSDKKSSDSDELELEAPKPKETIKQQNQSQNQNQNQNQTRKQTLKTAESEVEDDDDEELEDFSPAPSQKIVARSSKPRETAAEAEPVAVEPPAVLDDSAQQFLDQFLAVNSAKTEAKQNKTTENQLATTAKIQPQPQSQSRLSLDLFGESNSSSDSSDNEKAKKKKSRNSGESSARHKEEKKKKKKKEKKKSKEKEKDADELNSRSKRKSGEKKGGAAAAEEFKAMATMKKSELNSTNNNKSSTGNLKIENTKETKKKSPAFDDGSSDDENWNNGDVDSFYSNTSYKAKTPTNAEKSSNSSGASNNNNSNSAGSDQSNSAGSNEPVRKSSFFDRFRRRPTEENKSSPPPDNPEKEKKSSEKRNQSYNNNQPDYDEM